MYPLKVWKYFYIFSHLEHFEPMVPYLSKSPDPNLCFSFACNIFVQDAPSNIMK